MGAKRSAGCNTCRRRKVKCDEQRPTCQKCQSTRYKCEGYVRKHRFVDEVSRTIRDVKKDETNVSSVNHLHAPRHRSSIRPNLNLSAFEDNLYLSFLLSNLCLGVIMPTPLMRTHAEDTSSLVAQLSIRALGAAYFGRVHRHYGIMNRGTLIYGKALHHLVKDLQDSERALSLSTLSSAAALQTYEFIVASSNSGWLDHAGGIGRLIELRGLKRHQSQLERDVLEANRINIIIECSLRKKRCFLEQVKWKTEPWASEPESKDNMSYLLDILCDIPGLQDDARKLRDPEHGAIQDESYYQELAMNIEKHLKQLYAWRFRWEVENPNSCRSTVGQENLHEQSLFSTMFFFSSIRQADEVLLYNIILIIIWRMGIEVIGPAFSASTIAIGFAPTASRGPLYLPGEAEDIQMIGNEICKCVAYYLSDYRNTRYYLFIALRVAYIAFPPTSIQAKWVATTMATVADLNGFEIVKSCGLEWL